jgi:hypothetical protein
MNCYYKFVSHLKFTFIFLKLFQLIKCFSLYFSRSLYICTEYYTRKYCMCAFTRSLYYHCRLIKSTIKIFIIQDCPSLSLWMENELVRCYLSSILVNISPYTCFNQFSSTIPMFFVFLFYHIPSSHSFKLFGVPTIKRRHMKSVYQFKSYLHLKLKFICWTFITFYAHWTITDISPRKCK